MVVMFMIEGEEIHEKQLFDIMQQPVNEDVHNHQPRSDNKYRNNERRQVASSITLRSDNACCVKDRHKNR